jgi:hypothetical protein
MSARGSSAQSQGCTDQKDFPPYWDKQREVLEIAACPSKPELPKSAFEKNGRVGAIASARQQQDLIADAQALADEWAQLKPTEQIGQLRRLVHRVTVTRHRVDIAFSRAGLQATLTDSGDGAATSADVDEDTYLVSVPVRLQRCGIETRLVVPDGESAPAYLIKLAYLAPDIMEAIARCDIPSAISLDRLKEGFPLDWREQRKELGFSV